MIPDADLMHACTGCQAEAVAVHILTAKCLTHADLTHFLQHPAALRSKWCTRNIGLFRCHTWNFHQLRQILLHRRFLRSDPPPDLFSFVFFHRCSSFFRFFHTCSVISSRFLNPALRIVIPFGPDTNKFCYCFTSQASRPLSLPPPGTSSASPRFPDERSG